MSAREPVRPWQLAVLATIAVGAGAIMALQACPGAAGPDEPAWFFGFRKAHVEERCGLTWVSGTKDEFIASASFSNRPGTKWNHWSFDALRFVPNSNGKPWWCSIGDDEENTGRCMIFSAHCEKGSR